MELGVRQIRTAGKGSGSVELTLPGALRHLVGLPCRITLHDGERPDIVLRPDLTPALEAFATLWHLLRAAFSAEDSSTQTTPFPAEQFCFGLYPRGGFDSSLYLSWQDGLTLAIGSGDPSAAARSVATCAAQAADALDIAAAMAAPFGAVCGFLACGHLTFPEWQEPCDIAALEMAARDAWQPGAAWAAKPDVLSGVFWELAAPSMASASSLFAGWSLPGSAYPAFRAAWRRGRSIELNRG